MIKMERTDGMHSRTRKIDDTDVLLIRQLYKRFGVSKRREIAELFGLSPKYIYKIARKDTWAELEEP